MAQRDVFRVVADPTRRRILEVLRHGARPVGELARELQVSQPNVSKHLRTLAEADLVRARVVGPERHYLLDPDGLQDLDLWLAPFREIWADRLDALSQHLDDLATDDRTRHHTWSDDDPYP